MRRIMSLLAVLAIPLSGSAGPGDDEVRKELQALQGKWKAVALEAAGQPLPKEQIPDFTMVIGADGKSSGRTAQGEFRFTITVDPRKNPKTMENLHESGEQKGKKQYGIYKLEGDRFTVCITARGAAEGDRPKDFTTKGSANVVFVLERVKEAKKP